MTLDLRIRNRMKLRSKFCFLQNETFLAKRVPAVPYMVFLICWMLLYSLSGKSIVTVEQFGLATNQVYNMHKVSWGPMIFHYVYHKLVSASYSSE